MVKSKFADLHMHTVASDGTETVSQRIKQAQEQGLDIIAITDHDTINDELEERSFTENGVEAVTGSEIKAEINGKRIEILGLFLDPCDDGLKDLLGKNSEFRDKRMQKMVEKLNDITGSDIFFEDVKSRAEGNIGRPHLAEELVEKNVVEDQEEAFEKFIGKKCEAYVSTEKLSAEKVIETIHENGGVASLAHPGRDLEKSKADEIIGKLVGLGLDGLEVEYSYRHKIQEGYRVNFTEIYADELAEKHGLIKTGGSDCHGRDSGKFNIGKVRMLGERVEKLREQAESYQA